MVTTSVGTHRSLLTRTGICGWAITIESTHVLWFVWIGPIYTTVEKCTGRWRSLAQNMVIWGEGWYAGEGEKTINILFKLDYSWGQDSCMRLWGCSRNLNSIELPFQKKSPCWHPCHFFIHVQMFSTKGLGHSVNHHRTRVSLLANQILEFPKNSWPIDFSTIVVSNPGSLF